MNYGLYLSASGVLTNLYRQDVYANNLANVATVGFKPDVPTIRQRAPEAVEDGLSSQVNQRLLEKLGGGVLAGPQSVSFIAGSLEQTGGPLDVALDAPDAFFAVSSADPTNGNRASVRLTRDGRFTRSAQGYLVTVAGGHPVLDTQDQPIRINDGAPLTIDPAGRLRQNGQVVAQLQITAVRDPQRLVKHGQNLFGFEGQADPRVPAEAAGVRQGFVEASAVDPVTTLLSLVEATQAATANTNLIRYHDLLMDRAVNVLGRVA